MRKLRRNTHLDRRSVNLRVHSVGGGFSNEGFTMGVQTSAQMRL